MSRTDSELRLDAIELRQGKGRRLVGFAVDGKLLPTFTTISRISRGDDNRISGYQRPEVLSHIAEIRAYLESDNPMIPNALVVAFDERVRFEPSSGGGATPYSRSGRIIIPLEEGVPDFQKPGWIVDGQQRAAAIREAEVATFPIWVVGFIASSDREQREQFILVNSTKPLPKGLIYELLPNTDSRLPSMLQRRRFPTCLLDRLNHDDDSPLKDMVRTPTTTRGVIKDNSLIKMLENSLSDGVLYRYRDPDTGEGDVEKMLAVLKAFWEAVRLTFKNAWGVSPHRSRLMHGAGVIALGFVMDAIADRFRDAEGPGVEQFQADLEPLRGVCRWTDGYWEFGPGAQRKWNEIQNTPRDIQVLANYLLVQYKALVWSRPVESS